MEVQRQYDNMTARHYLTFLLDKKYINWEEYKSLVKRTVDKEELREIRG